MPTPITFIPDNFIKPFSFIVFMENLLPVERIERKLLVRISNPPVSGKFGMNPEERPVETLIEYGIINLDKPEGPTSHQVSAYAQNVIHIEKSGHSGTLDPNVTGVLPTATGKATRVVQALLSEGKEYVGIMHLHKEVEEKALREAVESFVGRIKQLPPVRSNVKRAFRMRSIYYFDILEMDKNKDVLFRTGTQAGTYIRKLCHDIGVKLGTGAHMVELRRSKVGHFNEKDSITLQDLADAYWYWKEKGNEKFIRKCIKPIEYAVEKMPKVWVLDSAVDTICHGANLGIPGIVKLESDIEKENTVALMTLKGELIGIGRALMTSKEMMKTDKGLAIKTEKVFMESGTYPKIDRIEKK